VECAKRANEGEVAAADAERRNVKERGVRRRRR
jgi:hypothetical protein